MAKMDSYDRDEQYDHLDEITQAWTAVGIIGLVMMVVLTWNSPQMVGERLIFFWIATTAAVLGFGLMIYYAAKRNKFL